MILSLKHQILHLEHWIEVLMSPRENSAEDFCSHLKKIEVKHVISEIHDKRQIIC